MSTILITGSSRGLGLELIKQYTALLPENGLIVAAARKSTPALEEVISREQGRVAFVTLDLADEASIVRSVEEVRQLLGDRKLEILVNCAGVIGEAQEKAGLWLQTDMGGSSADLTVSQGAKAVLDIVVAADEKSNGTFRNINVAGSEIYRGEEIPCDFVAEGHHGNDLSQASRVSEGSFRPFRPSKAAHNQGPFKQRRANMQTEHDRSSRGDLNSPAGTDSSNYHAAQARSIIEVELDDCRHISHEQQSALKAALDLVSQIADTERLESDATAEDRFSIDPDIAIPDAPPPELIFMLLPGKTALACFRAMEGYQWPDHISEESLERMATELLKEDCKGQVFHQYSVCVYVKAIFHSYNLARGVTSVTVKQQLFRSKSTYIAAAIHSIHKFDILAPPSLVSIQSLLSSAFLMQHLGRINQCWILNSYAARQITALGYHKIQETPPSSGVQKDIHNALLWCFYLDKCLSSLLGRPMSLPDLSVSPTDLLSIDSSLPYGSLYRIFLEVAQIQGELLSIPAHEKRNSNREPMDTIDNLEARMRRLLPDLHGHRSSTHRSIELDWISADFCYYAVLVEIYRTRLRCSFSPMTHKETLLCARRSLEAFQYLQQHGAEMPGFNDPYPSFLTCPFFVLFCNIIGSLDQRDYDLMQNIINNLSQCKHDPHLQKLLDLLTSLERLCAPLFQGKAAGNVLQGASNAQIRIPSTPVTIHNMNGSLELGSVAPQEGLLAQGMNQDASEVPNPEIGSSSDWLMWQLFNTQMPLGWMNPEFAAYGFN
ncbi:fungal specific transcription factor domain-containing protein [Aspergillus homomorphus CBS 101889]|uniref:Xylanolytic transcriptional activator regulatory domain-containing protein n=1 Tax=Aspergillus homomorphus (strain CBS 101889) TaxID=1450537 RepID=A0A395HS89_ASPHC|nr:hypothetical protein BO97DRAFT_436117 [Aspergillus homomorphus CBS 101889]RAL10283.1 hypothetical protein BO97DRAFT_436117 [Aspergillus homomorphus CBS 101889]